MKYLLPTTTSNNGCALASLSTVLSKALTAQNWEDTSLGVFYQSLLKNFQKVYLHPNLTWKDIGEALPNFAHPLDKQVLWLAPLRLTLSAHLISSISYRDKLFDIFVPALRLYIVDQKSTMENEYLNIFNSNRGYFEEVEKTIHQSHKSTCSRLFNKIYRSGQLKTYWEQKGYALYCQYLGKYGSDAPMITAEELSLLCAALHVSFAVHFPESSALSNTLQGYTGPNPTSSLTALCKHNHWQPYVDFEEYHYTHSMYLHAKQELSRLDVAQIRQKFIQAISDKALGSDPTIEQNLCETNLSVLRDYLKKNGEDRKLLKPALTVIAKAIQENNLFCLITFYRLMPACRNLMLGLMLTQNKAEIFKLTLFYDLLVSNISKKYFKNWEALLENAIPAIFDDRGDTPAHRAVKKGDLDFFQRESSITILTQVNHQGLTPLHIACATNNIKIVQSLIDILVIKGKQPQLLLSKDKQGRMPLHYAALLQTPTILNILITAQKNHSKIVFNIDAKDNNKQTLLHHAAMMGHISTFKVLLDHKAKLDSLDKDGNTPLHFAANNGHKALVAVLCDEIEKENANKEQAAKALGFFQRRLQALNPFRSTQERIKIDSKNYFGETPYMHAAMCKHDSVLTLLREKDPKSSDTVVYAYFIKAIYNIKTSQDPKKNWQTKKVKREERAALLTLRHQHLIARAIDGKGDNLIHHCVRASNYKMAHILLYSLSYKKRIKLCTRVNRDNLTPLALIDNRLSTVEKGQIEPLHRLKRLLLQYDINAYKQLKITQKIRYHINWTQDTKSELTSSSWYRKTSSLAFYGFPAVAFAKGTIESGGNMYLGFVSAFNSFFGNTPLDKIERMVGMIPSERLNRVRELLWWLALYRHTATRLTVGTCQYTASFILTQAKAEIGLTYLSNLNYLGAMLAVSEELTRYYGPQYLNPYWISVEDTLKNRFGVPTLPELTNFGLSWANAQIESLTTVNLHHKLNAVLAWARENIGRLPSPAAEFEKLEEKLMQLIVVEDEETRNLVKDLAKSLYIAYCDDPQGQNSRIYELINMANGAAMTDQGLQVVLEAISLLPDEKRDPYEILSTFLINTPFFTFLKLDEVSSNALLMQLKKDFQDNPGNFNDLTFIQKIHQLIDKNKVDAMIAKGGEIGKLIGLSLGIENINTQNLLTKLLENLFQENTSPSILIERLNNIRSFFIDGEFNSDINDMLNLLAQQGSNFSENLALLLINTFAFQQFNLDEASLNKNYNALAQKIAKLMVDKPDNLIAEINAFITQSFEEVAKSFVSDHFMPLLPISGTEIKDLASHTAIMILLQHKTNPQLANDKLKMIAQLLNGMALGENFDIIFDGILKDMVALGYDYESMLTLFISNSTLFEKEDLRKEMRAVIHQVLSENPDDSLAALKKILAHSENCLVDSFITNIFSPILKIDNSLKDRINQITKPFMIHYFNAPDLKEDLNLLLNYINDYSVTTEILSAMIKIAKTNEDPDQALTSLLLSSPLFLNTRLTPSEKSIIEARMLEGIRNINTSESSEYIEKLSEIIQTGEKQALQYYSAHQVSGNEVVNDAIGNGCEGVGGRSEYVSEHFIRQHRLSFYMYTGPEHDSARKAVYNFFNEKQGDRSGHNQDKIDNLKDAYGELERFLEVRFIVPTFMQGKPLDEPTRIYLAGLDGKDVRAIFGANLTQLFLSNSPGYTSLTFAEELKLYRDIVDTQHKYKHDHRKEEQQIFDLINAAITSHTVSTGEEHLLLGEFSIKDASASIQDNSKLAGENHWQGTPDELTRPIHPRESNWFRRQLNSIGTFAKNVGDKADKASDRKVSLGAATNGQSLDVGLRNNQTNEVHGLHIGFGKTPSKPLFEDEKPKIESTGFSDPSEKDIDIEQLAEVEAFNWKMIMERYPEVKQTPLMQEMDQGWHDLIERTYHKRDETDYVQDFARIYDQMHKPTPPAPVAPPVPIERVNQLSVSNQEITQSGMSAEPEALPKYPLARKILLAPLYYTACAISGDARANPVAGAFALAGAATATAAGAAFMGWMASFKRHDEDQDDDAPPNPWVKLLDSFYPGRHPEEGEEIDSSSAFPAEERQGWKLETPIDHSITKAINAAGKHIIPILPMMYLSKNGRGELNAGNGNDSKKSNGTEANNHINGLRIRRQLAAEEASSIFTKNGGLRQDIIDKSTVILDSENFKNNKLISELEALGGDISDWAKYKTPLISGPAGRFEIHFYRNSVTKEVYYGRDYKAVLDHQGKWNSELKPAFEYEPPRFGN